jgi:hypothetical protein
MEQLLLFFIHGNHSAFRGKKKVVFPAAKALPFRRNHTPRPPLKTL